MPIHWRSCCLTWAIASQACVGLVQMARTMKTAQRDKYNVGPAKQTVIPFCRMDFRKQSTFLAPVWIWTPPPPFPALSGRTLSECHVASLHYASPSPGPVRGLAETTFGERNSRRVETTPSFTPFEAPTTPQPVPPPSRWQRDNYWGEHLQLHSPVSHEGGVQHLSLLRFMLERLVSGDLFSGQCVGHTVRIRSMTGKQSFVTSPVCSADGAKCHNLGKAAHPSYLS